MFKEIQQEVNSLEDYIYSKSRSDKDSVFVLLTHLLAECGEAADEIKGMEGKRAESPSEFSKGELAKELVDIIFNVLRIAHYYDIDVDKYFDERLKGIRDKFS
ncbi:MazG-like family protein [Patescibacteria group bacterium]|nr:MazG-like family protein [Patescibacteria group bacterium]